MSPFFYSKYYQQGNNSAYKDLLLSLVKYRCVSRYDKVKYIYN